ncbi:MAG: hypothetical protein ACKO81_12615, partial [Planctomycetota bacterium]
MRTSKYFTHLALFAAAFSLTIGPAFAQEQKLDTRARLDEVKAKRADDKRLNRISKSVEAVEGFEPVELFAAMESGSIQVVIKTKDSSEANIIVTNKSDKPLSIEMPAAFAAVPVMAQGLGMGGGG